jgi:hypothetical protein
MSLTARCPALRNVFNPSPKDHAPGAEESMDSKKIKLLYIAGSGRSGTTLIARLLGELDGFVNVGEAALFLFDPRLRAKGLPCGCGRAVEECPFWKEAAETISPAMAAEAAPLLRMRCFPALMRQSNSGRIPPAYAPILAKLASVYQHVVATTGCRVIVDSSKNPTNGLLASLAPNVEMHVLHVVRDPHNVVASWTKKKGYLATHPASRVVAWWWSYNLLSEALKCRTKSYRLVRYEDFLRDPGAVLQAAAADVVGSAPEMPFLQGMEATIRQQHSLAGNPDKLDSGKVRIGEPKRPADDSHRWLVNLLTFPLQMRYRYPVRPTG